MSEYTDLQASVMTGQIRIAKAQLWEETKGKLRALVSVEGQCFPHEPLHQHHRDRLRALSKEVEKFVYHIECKGLHE